MTTNKRLLTLLLSIPLIILVLYIPHGIEKLWKLSKDGGVSLTDSEKQSRYSSRKSRTLYIGQNQLDIEIAETNAQITRGLGERDSLGSDGMLFVMPSRSVPAFWMKGMRFALDFVWIDGATVVDLTENVPDEPEVPDHLLRTYSPKAPITHVLELNAGEIARRGIQIGDKVTY